MSALDFLRPFMAAPLSAATGGTREEIMQSLMATLGALGAKGLGGTPGGAGQQLFPDLLKQLMKMQTQRQAQQQEQQRLMQQQMQQLQPVGRATNQYADRHLAELLNFNPRRYG